MEQLEQELEKVWNTLVTQSSPPCYAQHWPRALSHCIFHIFLQHLCHYNKHLIMETLQRKDVCSAHSWEIKKHDPDSISGSGVSPMVDGLTIIGVCMEALSLPPSLRCFIPSFSFFLSFSDFLSFFLF